MAGITPDYFRALAIPILRGRAFTPAEMNGPRGGYRQSGLRGTFLSRRRRTGQTNRVWVPRRLVARNVGIVGDAKQQAGRSVDAFIIDPPFSQFSDCEAFVIGKFSRIPPERLARTITAAVHGVDSNQPVYDIATMQERLGTAVAPQRINMTLMTLFAALALLLATMGIFGVTAYFVSRHVHEIGIRLALGATLIFALVAAADCLIPAHQASRVDPAVALRYE